MPQQLHWRELTGGIIAAAAIVVMTILTLIFARIGGLHGKKVTLYAVTDEAAGVLPGTEVWLAGQQQGVVKEISFRPPSTDTTERLLIRMDFLEKGLPQVRRDSYAQLRPSGSIIGPKIVYISAGSVTSPPLREGDTVHTRPKPQIVDLTEDVGRIEPAISELVASVDELNAKLSNPAGTIGSARAYGMPQMPEVGARMSRIAAKASRGSGTIGLATRTDLMSRASRAMAAADSIRTLVSSNKGSLGRFRRDTALVTKANGVLAELDSLRAFASNPIGSIAGAKSDSTLTRQLARRRVLLASLIRDIKANPLRYINF
ncbi:MAG TPA: MlaD family protein [Gemmatimonadaceae bacterium]|nr:MlaD family protein [Gemmatimonadaceae bacterium]